MTQLTPQQYTQLREQGLDDATIKNVASSKGYTLPNQNQQGIIPSLGTGVVKGFIGDIARPAAQALQGIGQRAIAAVSPLSLDQVRQKTGFKSLDDRTPEGQSVVQSLKTQNTAEDVGRIGINIASFFIPASPAVKAAGSTLKATGKLATRAGIGLSSKEAPLMQAYKARYSVPERILSALHGKTPVSKPLTNAETAVRKSLFGTESMIGVQANRAANSMWKQVIAPSLKRSTVQVDVPSFINELAQEIRLVPELSRRSELQRALSAFADDYSTIGKVSLAKLQNLKSGWAKFLPEKTYRGSPVGSAFKEIQNMAASLARNKIYKGLSDIEARAAYLDYGNLKNLQALGQKSMTGSKLKGGAGSFVSGLYDKVVTPIATTAGLTLYKTGEGLEFVGKQGTNVLGHLFK